MTRSVRTHILFSFFLAGPIAYVALLASVPPVDRDALTHHLFIPKLYLLHGGIYEIFHIPFSYYPMNLDLLYLIPLAFNNDIAPKFIHSAFALITAFMIFRYLSRRTSPACAWLGALFFLTLPVIVRLSSTVYVDLGLICFFFAALLYLFDWIESGFRYKPLIISGVFCGLALGTKYNGLVGLFLLGLFVPFVYARMRVGTRHVSLKAAAWGALFVLVSLLVFSPWMVRNGVWTGNPVYPLYNKVFNPPPPSVEKNDKAPSPRISHIQARRELYGESWAQIALIPLRVFFQGKDDDFRLFDGRTSPFLLILPLCLIPGFRTRSRQEKIEILLMLFFSLLFLLYACAQTSIRIRYFSPILPPLVVLSMLGLHNFQTRILAPVRWSGPVKTFLIFAVITVMLGLNAAYMVERFKKDRPLEYLTGKVTRDEYIQAFRPEYAAFQYANAHLAKDAKIFGLFMGGRGYYSDRYIAFSDSLLYRAAKDAASGKDVATTLTGKGFTHILMSYPAFNSWLKEVASDHDRQVLRQFFESHIRVLFSKDGYGLLQIGF
ncbi:ArnT family glycosyltransferase [Desulfotignum phosphitoxidans]|uniref:Transposase YhgA family protein n=1 Tax=Desulfotignum phosphitoxidans DSM 13687 TaxID=1286635 RepID=S0G512_9BACT|nr:glycosyltransferase family 39 protein [Desulfotignum phosphitoxidans]EMS80849.1 transposase YhgA family protein [Desulfotignum phosphitoxidans DSM 13687]